jgi:oligopeptide/dipeptide ABC transporter ATP-binding protein
MFGDVDLGDRKPARLPRRVPGLAMVFQDASTSLDPVWTIGSQLRSVIRATQKTSRKQTTALAVEWLRKVGLTDTERVMRSRPYELSGGMRQRAMIAIALSGTPELLIADEPTSALDASLSRDAMKLLVELTDELGSGLMLVSHDIHLCQEFVDRMLVMYSGHVVESGYAATLDREAAHPYTQALLRSVPTLESAELDELPTIPLTMAGQADPQGGCAFRPRCDRAHDACSVAPPLIELPARGSAAATAACWLADESAAPAMRAVRHAGEQADHRGRWTRQGLRQPAYRPPGAGRRQPGRRRKDPAGNRWRVRFGQVDTGPHHRRARPPDPRQRHLPRPRDQQHGAVRHAGLPARGATDRPGHLVVLRPAPDPA